MMSRSTTAVTILTPQGRGAVAVIVVEGPMAVELVEQFFWPKGSTRLVDLPCGRIVYGRWGSEPAEDVIACRRSDACVEVHCHGGNAAARRIADDLMIAGAAEQPWSDWTCAHEGSVIGALARIELARAVTARTAEILLDQYDGALDRRLREILAKIENGDCATRMIDELLAHAPVGLHLTEPWRVVVAGPPNVGKSSLVNALVGYERAIVFDQPGTTRDVVTAHAAFSGWPVELCDTAGLRASADPLESAGVERARQQAGAADCLLLVFDGSQAWSAEQQELIDAWPNAIIVDNKCDLGVAERSAARGRETVATSALREEGISELMDRIVRRLAPVEPAAGEAVPFSMEHVERLEAAKAALNVDDDYAARGHLLALLAPREVAESIRGDVPGMRANDRR
jgi:tRNA modification GTPase